MNLYNYVKRRNGVPLGHGKSLQNMLYRSLGSGTFAGFWRYWNPIWSFYLGKYIYKPLKSFLPSSLSLLITFAACGFMHDLAIIALKKLFILLLTPWFLLMGFLVLITKISQFNYSKYPWIVRALINITFIFGSLLLVYQIR